MTGVTPVLYAFTLGLVAAVNPCGFPLLPAYLALFAGGEHRPDWVGRTARGMTAGHASRQGSSQCSVCSASLSSPACS